MSAGAPFKPPDILTAADSTVTEQILSRDDLVLAGMCAGVAQKTLENFRKHGAAPLAVTPIFGGHPLLDAAHHGEVITKPSSPVSL